MHEKLRRKSSHKKTTSQIATISPDPNPIPTFGPPPMDEEPKKKKRKRKKKPD